jgi:hypothetical protein
MTTTASLRGLAFAASIAFGLAPIAAHAQHVVTEAEASKLTLEALTAAPRPVYRPIYRAAYFRPIYGSRFGHGRAHGLSRVSYRTAVSSHARHHHRR